MNKLIALFLTTLAAAQTPPEAVFQSGTRLVEVEVVVRSQRARPASLGSLLAWALDSGPPWGPPGVPIRSLTMDDFTLLDNGKPQPIAVFNAGPRGEAGPMAVPPGAVSNRTDDRGLALSGATAVLVDFIETPWIDSEYMRVGVKNLLRGLKPGDPVSIYTVGKKLHVLPDGNGGLDLKNPEVRAALRDYGDPPTAHVDSRQNAATMIHALQAITQHLDGLPGRKNLIWVGGHPSNSTIAAFQQAGIVVYPVRVRSAGFFDTKMPSGGRMFLDAMDLTYAVRTAEEDEGAAYVLGFYPGEAALDGKNHLINVQLTDPELRKKNPEVHHRAGYLATKLEVLPSEPSLADAFNGPLNATAIGLAAQAIPLAARPGVYDLHITVDLRDIHMERQGDRFIGAFDFAITDPSAEGSLKAGEITLSLTNEQFTTGRDSGFILVIKDVDAASGQTRIVVRDRATGVAGSLRIPVPQ